MTTTACDDQFNDPPIETSETEARPYAGGTPENIRAGAPYDDPAFERLAREHDVWGRAESALCAVFWLAGKAQPPSGQSVAPADNGEPPFLQRLRAEFSDLAERQAKLTAFIGTPGFRMLDDADANLLARQARLHQSLLEVLEERIQLASAKHGAPKTTGGDNGE